MIVVELLSVFKVLANYIMMDDYYHVNMVLVIEEFRRFSSIKTLIRLMGNFTRNTGKV